MLPDITIEKHEDWTHQNPIWRIQFPVTLPDQKIVVPDFDLPVTVEFTVASVTVVGKTDAERVAERLRHMLTGGKDAEDD